MDPFIGEIRLFGGTFAPVGWAFCDGSLLPISQYDALFALIGTTYGGDGVTTFALPDIRGRLPVHQGNNYVMGQMSGSESVTLNVNQIPNHRHTMGAGAAAATGVVTNDFFASGPTMFIVQGTPYPLNSKVTIADGGGNQPHDNMQPFLAVTFIISLQGIFPSRN
jgi:microcystin-dependent protein